MNKDYIKKIKSLVSNIDFDDITRILFNEYLDFEYASSEKLFNMIKKSVNKPFYDIKYEDVVNIVIRTPDFILEEEKIFTKYLWERQDDKSVLIDIQCKNDEEIGFYNQAIIDNPDNFVKQILNLMYLLNINLEKECTDKKKTNIEIKLNNGKTYSVVYPDSTCLLFRYIKYNLYVYNENIHLTEPDTPQNYEEIFIDAYSRQYSLAQELTNILKNHFDNIDFIYAILIYLNNEDKLKLYKTCIEENENYIDHMPMNNIFQFISTAFSLAVEECPENVKFYRYYKEKLFETPEGEEIYNELSKIFKYEYEIMNIILQLPSRNNANELLKIIKLGVRNKKDILLKALEINDLEEE